LKAVQITVNARGSRTAGVDKVLLRSSEEKYYAALSLSVENYAAKFFGNGRCGKPAIPIAERFCENISSKQTKDTDFSKTGSAVIPMLPKSRFA
jgi:hypothetical protein